MIGTSLWELVFIRISIFFLRYMPALYAAGLAYNIFIRGEQSWTNPANLVFASLLLAEGLYFGFLYLPHKRRLQQAAKHPEPPSKAERRALFEACIASTSQQEQYLRGWFMGSPISDIRRDNVREFLAWAFFDVDAQDAAGAADMEAIQEELDEYVALIEHNLDEELGEGRGPAQSLRLTFDSVTSAYRCLLWYFVVFLVDQATHCVLLWHGFQYHARSAQVSLRTFPPRPQELLARHRSPVAELGYWYKPHRSRNMYPAIFFHGIGIGLWTYVKFIVQLSKSGSSGGVGDGVGMLVPELLPISFRLTDPPVGKEEFLRRITKVLDHVGWDEFTLVSHSYGSVPTTHMLSAPSLKPRIKAIVLIDPVTILLHLPDVAYNFTRRPPRRANEWQLWYYASMDVGVALCLGRHFFWRDNILWKEDLLSHFGSNREPTSRRRLAVCLSGKDLIVDARAVAEYLEAPAPEVSEDGSAGTAGSGSSAAADPKVVLFPHLDHAQVFDNRRDYQRVVDLILSCSCIDHDSAR